MIWYEIYVHLKNIPGMDLFWKSLCILSTHWEKDVNEMCAFKAHPKRGFNGMYAS